MRISRPYAIDRLYANCPNLDLDILRSEEKESQPLRNVAGIPKGEKKIKPKNEEEPMDEKEKLHIA